MTNGAVIPLFTLKKINNTNIGVRLVPGSLTIKAKCVSHSVRISFVQMEYDSGICIDFCQFPVQLNQ